jgi:hypothetical protein
LVDAMEGDSTLPMKVRGTLTGAVQKGPFAQGATVIVQELDEHLDPTGTTFVTATTSDLGDFSLSVTLHSPYVEIIASGFFYDEISGRLSAAPLTLHSLAAVGGDATIYVNVLTSLAAPRVRALVSATVPFEQALAQAESDVLSALDMPAVAATHFTGMTIAQMGDSNAVLLAVTLLFEQFAAYTNPSAQVAQLSSLIATVATTIATSGSLMGWSDRTIMRCAVPASIDVATVNKNLTNHYAASGHPIQLPAYEPYLAPPSSCRGDAGGDEASTVDGGPPVGGSCSSATLCPVGAAIGGIWCAQLDPDPDGSDRYYAFATTNTGFMVLFAACGTSFSDPVQMHVEVTGTCGDQKTLLDQYGLSGPNCPEYELDFQNQAPGTYWIKLSGMNPHTFIDLSIKYWNQ